MSKTIRSAFAETALQFAAAIFAFVALAAPSFATEDTPSILERTPCKFSFEKYDEWLAFMDKAPDPAWRSPAMRELFNEASFNRYRDQTSLSCDKLVYLSDGLKINGFVIAPRIVDEPAPVVLFAHGGVAQWGRITFFDLLEMHRLAERGYVVIASALRGEGGSEGAPNLGAGDRSDMLRLIDIAKHIDVARASRIGFWGFSRGGGLGYRVLAETDEIKTAVLIGAPSDLVNSERREEFHEHVYPGVVDNYGEDQDKALAALSAAYWPERLSKKTPILLIHGADDVRVPVSNSLTMAEHLARLDHPFRLVVPRDGSHTLIEHQEDVRDEMDRWFDAYLKPPPDSRPQQ